MIDWRQPAARISARVRAFNPWPVAQTTLQGQTLRVWLAQDLEHEVTAEPGEIVRAESGELVVAAGDGALSLTALQLPGRRVTSAADFLHAWRGDPLAGRRLGR